MTDSTFTLSKNGAPVAAGVPLEEAFKQLELAQNGVMKITDDQTGEVIVHMSTMTMGFNPGDEC
jgi:hypothetical protein